MEFEQACLRCFLFFLTDLTFLAKTRTFMIVAYIYVLYIDQEMDQTITFYK